ncbi:hypothetical protein KPH14_004140 [Odynerus spinipes]|uniref:Odorant receptor n=1 Tax=Odynerus spinipes TaxID=1348599 RepID=A0AAD9RY29_9HYME|nr:hypothetical protein KPH14_004140 [Odynerus spinipes]
MKKRCSGFDYGFSIIELGMSKLGVWPLQRNNLAFYDVRWSFVTAVNLIIALNLLTEICMGCGDVSNTLESFLILNASIHAICNCLFPKIHRKKLAENVNAAIEDWSCSSGPTKDEESRAIMRRYARASRFIGTSQLILGFMGCSFYFVSILVIQTHQVDETSNGTLQRRYIIPAKCFFDTVSNTEYNAILLLQMFQALTLLVTQWAVDSFFFGIVLHLCGQLDILKNCFSNFLDEECSTKEHRRKEFRAFVERHCRLINLAYNLEDVFHLSIMIQLLMNAYLIALTGFRLILSMRSSNNVETMKSLLFMKFTIMQSFLYTCAGDLLQGHSEDVFHTLWQKSWHDLPSPMIRNCAFVMMRSKKPLRISAGKFIYVSRITLMDIMKAAASYISFLQITI